MKLGNIPQVGHIREVPLGDGNALRDDLAGPQGLDPIKRGGIGKTPYAVEQGTERKLLFIQFFFPPLLFLLLSNSIWNFARPSSSVVSRTSAL